MNKEQMELKKVIRDGVVEGIKKGIEDGLKNVNKPVYETAQGVVNETGIPIGLKTSARQLKKFCEKMSCCDCMFMDVASRDCTIRQPEDWKI